MNYKLKNNLLKTILIPKGELELIIDTISYSYELVDSFPLSHPKRLKYKEKYYILLNYLMENYHKYKLTSKTPYLKIFAKYEYTEINYNSTRTAKYLGRPWGQIKKDLLDLGIIEDNNSYSSDGKQNKLKRPFSTGYRINHKWLDDQHWEFDEITSINPYARDLLLDDNGKLNKCFITLDTEQALEKAKEVANIKNWSPITLRIYQMKILRFNHTLFKNKECSTGRIFNKINCLPSKLRDLVKIDGKDTSELDIKSCLPSILFKFCTDKSEAQTWAQLIKDGIYKHFTNKCDFIQKEDGDFDKAMDRSKLAFCCYLGGSKKADSLAIGRVLAEEFPILHASILEITTNPKKKRGELSRVAQRIESNIVVKGMSNKPYTAISIHDGVRVELDNLEDAYLTIHQNFKNEVGCDCVLTGYDPPQNTKPNLKTIEVGLNEEEQLSNIPTFSLFSHQGTNESNKKLNLRSIIQLAKENITLAKQQSKKVNIQKLIADNPNYELSVDEKKTLNHLPFISPPNGTCILQIKRYKHTDKEFTALRSRLKSLPFVGAVLFCSTTQLLYIFGKASSQSHTYNRHCEVLKKKLTQSGVTEIALRVQYNQHIELPHDPMAWVTDDWDGLESIPLTVEQDPSLFQPEEDLDEILAMVNRSLK